jgi:hypothetical protein
VEQVAGAIRTGNPSLPATAGLRKIAQFQSWAKHNKHIHFSANRCA